MTNGSMTSWMEVKSGNYLGAPSFYIDAELSSAVSLFADDCAIYREVSSTDDCEIL